MCAWRLFMCFSGLKQKGHISGGWSAGCVPEVSRSLRFVFSRQTLTWLPRGERRRKGPHSNRTARKHANNILGSMCDNSWLSRVCIVAKVSSHSLHRYWPCAGKRRGGGGKGGFIHIMRKQTVCRLSDLFNCNSSGAHESAHIPCRVHAPCGA